MRQDSDFRKNCWHYCYLPGDGEHGCTFVSAFFPKHPDRCPPGCTGFQDKNKPRPEPPPGVNPMSKCNHCGR